MPCISQQRHHPLDLYSGYVCRLRACAVGFKHTVKVGALLWISQVEWGLGARPVLIWRVQIYPELMSHVCPPITRWTSRDLSGSVCMCGTVTQTDCKSLGDITSACVQTVNGLCLVLLLGNRRVTLWCNRKYEHINLLFWLYRKEKRGRRSLRGWKD